MAADDDTLAKQILVPIDGSDGSRRAVEAALQLAASLGAEVVLLEVIEDPGPLPTYNEKPPEGRDRDEWLFEERFKPMRPVLEHTEVPWRREVEHGYPADQICRVAEEEGYDLIVMGHRGMSAVGRFLMGSVSDRVVHHAPCNVMIVK